MPEVGTGSVSAQLLQLQPLSGLAWLRKAHNPRVVPNQAASEINCKGFSLPTHRDKCRGANLVIALSPGVLLSCSWASIRVGEGIFTETWTERLSAAPANKDTRVSLTGQSQGKGPGGRGGLGRGQKDCHR